MARLAPYTQCHGVTQSRLEVSIDQGVEVTFAARNSEFLPAIADHLESCVQRVRGRSFLRVLLAAPQGRSGFLCWCSASSRRWCTAAERRGGSIPTR
jgi:hypothetical protein